MSNSNIHSGGFITGPRDESSAHDQNNAELDPFAICGAEADRIKGLSSQLGSLLLGLPETARTFVDEYEEDFFMAYRLHMGELQARVRALKDTERRNEEIVRSDPSVLALTKELDWFMAEAVRLDQHCIETQKSIEESESRNRALKVISTEREAEVRDLMREAAYLEAGISKMKQQELEFEKCKADSPPMPLQRPPLFEQLRASRLAVARQIQNSESLKATKLIHELKTERSMAMIESEKLESTFSASMKGLRKLLTSKSPNDPLVLAAFEKARLFIKTAGVDTCSETVDKRSDIHNHIESFLSCIRSDEVLSELTDQVFRPSKT